MDRLKELQENKASTVSSEARLLAEIEIDEFFYQLVSAKDALLQEINQKLQLILSLKDVNTEKINSRLKDQSREDVMAKINRVGSEGNWLWLVNEFHNISKHRQLVAVNDKITKVALYRPDTEKAMYKDILDYLPDWLKKLERLVADIRSKISKIYAAENSCPACIPEITDRKMKKSLIVNTDNNHKHLPSISLH